MKEQSVPVNRAYSGISICSGRATVHQDPYSKGQRITNTSGNVVSTVELDPWGGDTSRSSNQAFQPHRFTTYERDANGGDDAMMRRYQGTQRRFAQPDPFDGSFDAADPQSFNRYSYTESDPVNFADPSGLNLMAGGGGGWSCSGTWSAMLQPDGTITDFMITSMGCYSWGGGGDSGGVPQNTSTPEPCKLVTPTFDQLSSVNPAAVNLLNRRFGAAAATKYGNLQPYFQAVLLNTVAAVADAGVNLSGARFEGFYFGSNRSDPPFGVELSGISNAGLGNLEDTRFGYRSPSSVKVGSVEATFGHGGNVAFDVDLYNPNGNLRRHTGEVFGNKLGQETTDPRDALKSLNSRGVQTGVTCQ